MTPILLGYFPKQKYVRPDWLEVPRVEEICSVCHCISSAPDDWMDHWLHNEFWTYDSPQVAWSIVPEASRANFDVYAWRIFPVRFTHGEEHAVEMPDLALAPLPPNFVRLGIDAVSRILDSSCNCSPLSCNYLAREIAVNRHCLIETEAEAFPVALGFSRTEPEPGPYYLIEVWRAETKANDA